MRAFSQRPWSQNRKPASPEARLDDIRRRFRRTCRLPRQRLPKPVVEQQKQSHSIFKYISTRATIEVRHFFFQNYPSILELKTGLPHPKTDLDQKQDYYRTRNPVS